MLVINVKQNDKIISNLIIKDEKFSFINALNFIKHMFVHYNEGLSKETREEIMAVRMFVRAIQTYFGYEKLINFSHLTKEYLENEYPSETFFWPNKRAGLIINVVKKEKDNALTNTYHFLTVNLDKKIISHNFCKLFDRNKFETDYESKFNDKPKLKHLDSFIYDFPICDLELIKDFTKENGSKFFVDEKEDTVYCIENAGV